jgi:hypothetical protein
MSYPVKWSMRKILRDYIQNFFDAVGTESFKDRFSGSYKDNTLIMQSDVAFDVDWLIYMGASSKRNTGKSYSGRFGEGFKVSSLVAYRDYNLEIVMESKDWRIIVTEKTDEIAGVPTKFLAYRKYKREDDGLTRLFLMNTSEEDYKLFLEEKDNFFYTGNPHIGVLLGSNHGHEVYFCPADSENEGMIFAGYQMRYSMHGYPFIVSNPYFIPDDDDRDREHLTMRDADHCATIVIMDLSPKESLKLLIKLEKFWKTGGISSLFSLNSIIRELIHNIERDEKCKKRFRTLYLDYLVSDFDKGIKKDRRHTAAAWFTSWNTENKRRVVKHEFTCLGIPDIAELCQKNGGFRVLRKAGANELRYIRILEETANICFGRLISYDSLPVCKIILNETAITQGLANCVRNDRVEYGLNHIRIKSNIRTICIKASLLKPDMFAEACSTYMHELLHQYGGERDRSFHKALEELAIETARSFDKLERFENKWQAIQGAA